LRRPASVQRRRCGARIIGIAIWGVCEEEGRTATVGRGWSPGANRLPRRLPRGTRPPVTSSWVSHPLLLPVKDNLVLPLPGPLGREDRSADRRRHLPWTRCRPLDGPGEAGDPAAQRPLSILKKGCGRLGAACVESFAAPVDGSPRGSPTAPPPLPIGEGEPPRGARWRGTSARVPDSHGGGGGPAVFSRTMYRSCPAATATGGGVTFLVDTPPPPATLPGPEAVCCRVGGLPSS